MIINRHNYEEHFILYWDNELTVSQKQAIENFVKENPDLQEEFNILGQTRFTPDNNVRLEEKEFLLNNSFINITNYEEQLLNYIDDEVTADQRKEVEKFVSQYSVGKQELALLQRTKLQPEAEITFPDKSVLYRREENTDSYRHRVISMTWFRVAVAAAIILIAGFATFRLVNTNNKGGEVATTTPKKSNSPIDSLIDSPTNEPRNSQQPDNVKLKQSTPSVQPVIEKKNRKPVIENKIDNTIAIYKPENKNNLPKERKNINQQPDNKSTTIDGIIADVNTSNLKRDDGTVVKNKSEAISADFDNSDVTLTAKPTLDIPVVPGEKEKGGLKEFLRKTTRVFERRTKIQTTTDDNKLLLGAFAVSLK
jgi:hypothetical protein